LSFHVLGLPMGKLDFIHHFLRRLYFWREGISPSCFRHRVFFPSPSEIARWAVFPGLSLSHMAGFYSSLYLLVPLMVVFATGILSGLFAFPTLAFGDSSRVNVPGVFSLYRNPMPGFGRKFFRPSPSFSLIKSRHRAWSAERKEAEQNSFFFLSLSDCRRLLVLGPKKGASYPSFRATLVFPFGRPSPVTYVGF